MEFKDDDGAILVVEMSNAYEDKIFLDVTEGSPDDISSWNGVYLSKQDAAKLGRELLRLAGE